MKDTQIPLVVLLLLILLWIFVIGLKANHYFWSLDSRLEEIESKIMLHDGKAVLTNGQVCIITSETLADEQLSIQLVRACVKAHREQQETQTLETAP